MSCYNKKLARQRHEANFSDTRPESSITVERATIEDETTVVNGKLLMEDTEHRPLLIWYGVWSFGSRAQFGSNRLGTSHSGRLPPSLPPRQKQKKEATNRSRHRHRREFSGLVCGLLPRSFGHGPFGSSSRPVVSSAKLRQTIIRHLLRCLLVTFACCDPSMSRAY